MIRQNIMLQYLHGSTAYPFFVYYNDYNQQKIIIRILFSIFQYILVYAMKCKKNTNHRQLCIYYFWVL